MSEADRLRVSDAERHEVAEVLRAAAGEGRLDLEELDERLEAAYKARTYADLAPLTIDLPGTGPSLVKPPAVTPATRPGSPPVPTDLPVHGTSVAVMSGQDRKGVWAVGSSHQAVAVMGGVTLDLREAVFTAPEVVITCTAIMGGVDVVVGPRVKVVVEGIGVMGGFDQARDKVPAELDEHSPVVRVRGLALMGGVCVTRKGPSRDLRKRLSR